MHVPAGALTPVGIFLSEALANPATPDTLANIDILVNMLSMLTSYTMVDMSRELKLLFDLPKLDPDDRRPAYLQVAEALRADIDAGTLPPGAKLPSHQDLVSHYGVSSGTIKRALGELQGAGVIVSRQGQGAFVRTNRPASDHSASELAELRRAVAELSDRVQVVERRLAEL